MIIWQDGDCDYVSTDFCQLWEHGVEEDDASKDELPTYESIVETGKGVEQEEVSEDSDDSILSCIDDEPYTVVASATIPDIPGR